MKELKPKKPTDEMRKRMFNPYENRYKAKYPVCCCGFELIKESENTWRCTGGNHRYIMENGDILKDKFGNLWFKKPENADDNGENKENED